MRRRVRLESCAVVLLCVAARAWPQNFWEQTNGPDGGVISAIAVSNSGTIVAGGALTGAYRSVDGGDTWEQAASGLLSGVEYVQSAAANPGGHFFVTGGQRVFRSTDGGLNWAATGGSIAPWPLVIQPNRTILGGGWGAVWRSSDEADTWDELHIPGLNGHARALALDPAHRRVYAGTTSNGIYSSEDNGETWAHSGLAGQWIWSVAVSPNGDVFAGARGPSGECPVGAVYRLENNGSSWQFLECFYWHYGVALAINSQGHIFAGGLGIRRSTDGGETWPEVGLPSRLVQTLAIDRRGTIFAGMTGGGVYRSSDNGESWEQAALGLKAVDVRSLLAASGNIFAGGVSDGVFRSPDRGQSWNLLRPTTWACCLALARNSQGHIFVAPGADGSYLGVSKDGGDTWSLYWPTPGPSAAVAVDGQDRVYLGASGGLYRSTDGLNWSRLLVLQDYQIITRIALAPERILAFVQHDGLWRSTDDGTTWERKRAVPAWQSDTALAVTPAGNILGNFCEVSGICGLHRSNDGGDSWSVVYEGGVSAMTVNDQTGQILAAVPWGPVISSSNEGNNWTSYDPGRPLYIFALALDSEGYLYGGAWGASVWRSTEPVSASAAPPAP